VPRASPSPWPSRTADSRRGSGSRSGRGLEPLLHEQRSLDCGLFADWAVGANDRVQTLDARRGRGPDHRPCRSRSANWRHDRSSRPAARRAVVSFMDRWRPPGYAWRINLGMRCAKLDLTLCHAYGPLMAGAHGLAPRSRSDPKPPRMWAFWCAVGYGLLAALVGTTGGSRYAVTALFVLSLTAWNTAYGARRSRVSAILAALISLAQRLKAASEIGVGQDDRNGREEMSTTRTPKSPRVLNP
jgi:hypothetical protein